jgi:ribosome-associated protein
VNKVNSKVTMRWKLMESDSLPPDVKERFVASYRNRLTTDGELVISSERFRDQSKNAQDCLEKLREMLQSIATAPKVRRPVKRTKASQRRRIADKRDRTITKERRRTPRLDD